MADMRAREVRINLILAVLLTVIGLAMRLLGVIALKNELFLPEYATTLKGIGAAVLAIGLLWLGLALIKRAVLPAARGPQ